MKGGITYIDSLPANVYEAFLWFCRTGCFAHVVIGYILAFIDGYHGGNGGIFTLLRALLCVICFYIIAGGTGAGMAWKGRYGVSVCNEVTRYPRLLL